MEKTIRLAEDTISSQDMDALSDWIRTYPRLTKGNLTKEYERLWSKWLGVKYSVFVNSGSSANLLMLSTLLETNELNVGDKVVVPALSWATDLAPVMQLGLSPILCDCNLENYSIDIANLIKIIEEHKPKALILVSVLGFPPDMDAIVSLCENNNIILLEDCCESLGTSIKTKDNIDYKKLGTYGKMSSFSTYFGHHISTIEGGMVCTDNERYYRILQSLRSHGWARDWEESERQRMNSIFSVSEFDSMYTFYFPGYNLRSTDLQAFLGIRQLKNIDTICSKRFSNFYKYQNLLIEKYKVILPANLSSIFISNFAFPILSENRNKLIEQLKLHNIECRPLICGSMGRQPFYKMKYGELSLQNADIVMKKGLYLPNHHYLTDDDIERICNVVNII